MARYYIEDFLTHLKAYAQTNLNTYINAINTENSDSLLLTVNNSAYFIETLIGETTAYDPFVFIKTMDITPIPNGPNTAKTFLIAFTIVYQVQPDMNDYKRLWRYHRAIEDMAKAGFNSIHKSIKTQISSLTPIDINFVNQAQQHRAIGVEIEATFK